MSEKEPTRGMRLLVKYIAGLPRGASTLASDLGINPSTVHYWRTGVNRPRYEHRILIEKYTGGKVPVDSWSTDDERKALRRAGGGGGEAA